MSTDKLYNNNSEGLGKNNAKIATERLAQESFELRFQCPDGSLVGKPLDCGKERNHHEYLPNLELN